MVILDSHGTNVPKRDLSNRTNNTDNLGMQQMFRQGDVLILEVPNIPTGATEVPDEVIVLAEGELTGHAHRVRLRHGTRGYRRGAHLFLKSDRAFRVDHEEHKPIDLPPGNYKVINQRVYLYGSVRVSD
jgi:hypothetical protein